MFLRPIQEHSVTLPSHCTACLKPIRLVYVVNGHDEGHDTYTCPHCARPIRIRVPGTIQAVSKVTHD